MFAFTNKKETDVGLDEEDFQITIRVRIRHVMLPLVLSHCIL